ncbi:hypothetical protein RRG08_056024 [Elysia crispata]|uniref:Uncharacterized protein n=1 Tax=Elysia crispata TaxID=231223 RepID=A0AAE1DZH6_9GAST|nr:hypothetical protein RRG08_056024 [Elysia crispata]
MQQIGNSDIRRGARGAGFNLLKSTSRLHEIRKKKIQAFCIRLNRDSQFEPRQKAANFTKEAAAEPEVPQVAARLAEIH